MTARWLRAIDARLESVPRTVAFLCAIFLACAIAYLDKYSGPDLVILYLIPIALVSWYSGRISGFATSVASTMLGYLTHTIKAQDADQTQTIRLVAYIAIAYTVSRLREARTEKEHLLNYIVHDLRSPISSAITGLMTLDQTSRNLDALDKEMVELALVSNQRALSLVNSMLDVAKLESGKMEVRPELVDVDRFLDDCTMQVALWAQGASVELRFEAQVESLVFDPALTSRVVINLLGNALKFSPPGSAVLVRAVPDPEGTRFEVIDQGPGIPPEYVNSIFERFTQVKGTQGGTGLGLTFCKLAISAQKGHIGVTSEVGRGSNFWFTLPEVTSKPS